VQVLKQDRAGSGREEPTGLMMIEDQESRKNQLNVVEERVETIESNFSDQNMTPKTKLIAKLKRKITNGFKHMSEY